MTAKNYCPIEEVKHQSVATDPNTPGKYDMAVARCPNFPEQPRDLGVGSTISVFTGAESDQVDGRLLETESKAGRAEFISKGGDKLSEATRRS